MAVALVLMCNYLVPVKAGGQTTFWVAEGAGNWMVSSNWSLGAPFSTWDAQINNGGTARLFDPGAVARIVGLADGPGNSGTLEILGGTANLDNYIDVGRRGTGILNIRNGGRLLSSLTGGASSDIALAPNSNGVVTVSGPQSS